ncbi:MAG: hypothetical protein G01um10148_384 [Parcubacteria group bacterium Gr01-1014_8]|nr:MAG: hypothetical protein G01um10148_384 [Parcubacteria group bacterium Gr01-1014_8]
MVEQKQRIQFQKDGPRTFESAASHDVKHLKDNLELFLFHFPPESRKGDVVPNMTLRIENAVNILERSPNVMKLQSKNDQTVCTTYAIPNHSAGMFFFDDVNGVLAGMAFVVFSRNGAIVAPTVEWVGTLPDFSNMGLNTERIKRVAAYCRTQGWPPLEATNGFVDDFARKTWQSLVQEGVVVEYEKDKFRFIK